METLNDIVEKLLETDTKVLIERLAQKILEQPESISITQVNQSFGIILLAVDDAKTSDHPSGANRLYHEVFLMTKELMGGAV